MPIKKRRNPDIDIKPYQILIVSRGFMPNPLLHTQYHFNFKTPNNALSTIESKINDKYTIMLSLINEENRVIPISDAVIPRTNIILAHTLYFTKIDGLTNEMQQMKITPELEEQRNKIIQMQLDKYNRATYIINGEIKRENFILHADLHVITYKTLLDSSKRLEDVTKYYEKKLQEKDMDLRRQQANFAKNREAAVEPLENKIKDMEEIIQTLYAKIKSMERDVTLGEIRRYIRQIGHYEDAEI